MQKIATGRLRPKRLSCAVSLAVASLVTGNAALAQEQAGSGDSQTATVLVVGTRASQQSSIDRKKNAATAMDSIVAEDVGALPDRNVGEAISRISGIALDRGDYGEGVSVAVRGNAADLTRVELDGQGVQSPGGTDMNGGGNGRGVEFRQLSADLIKSVDVVKGSTADMNEGSLGGGIIIKTRTGLDFKKPFVSLRAATSQSSLNKKWTPDANLIASDKFLDGRLGLLLNASHNEMANEAHSVQVAQSAQQGYTRLADFDNSPDKTFSYQPGTVNAADSAATTPILRSPLAGGAFFNSATPLEIITKSAAAKTKADCYTAFPILNATQLAAITPSASRGPAQSARGNELLSCLNQWNDYTPSNLRYFVKRENDKRQNLDLRADFKVNNQLTVYAKGSYNKRETEIHQLTYNLGGALINPSRTISPTYVGPTYTDSAATQTRSAVPGSGYYVYNSPSAISNNYPYAGTVANIIPGSIVADANHHLTKYSISDGVATTDQLIDRAETTAQYLQLGGAYKNGGLTAEFFVGDAESDFRRAQKRISYVNNYGPATLEVLPNGLWGYSFPAGGNFNQSDPSQYTTLYPATSNVAAVNINPSQFINRASPAYTIAQQPKLTQQPSPFWNPQIRASSERTAKLDLTYATPDWFPLFNRLKSGFNLRDTSGDSWDPNGGNSGGIVVKAAVGTYGQPGYTAPVVLPTPIIRSTFFGCENTPGSLGTGGAPCQYGFLPNADPRRGLDGQMIVTPQQFRDVITQSLTGQATSTQFFSGAKGRPANLLNNWTQIDVDKAFALINMPNQNYDCVKSCTASDGKVYDQPAQRFKERTEAIYLMGDFRLDHVPFTSTALPFGWEIDGNIGLRYVRNRVYGTGLMSFTSIMTTPSYDSQNPNAAAGIVTNTITQNTKVDATSSDKLPSFNAAMWLLPDQLVLRYNIAKTVARPPVSQLLPAGTCTYDERLVLADPNAVQRCTGTIGNPALQARRNTNQNLSFEYYPNKDTMVSVAAFKQEGKIGPAIAQGLSNVPLFAGNDLTIPLTDVKLADLAFDYSTWLNGAASTRKGVEFGGKTAFTFLPWQLRYTGLDLNYTKLRSVVTAVGIVDLLTGVALPPQRESKYTYNLALWYDDGKLSARVAVQAVASSFTCVAGCGQLGMNNYPSAAGGVTNRLPYSPGSPNFKDATRFIDGKIGYRWRPNIEFFAEGRNLGNATTSNSQGTFSPFADGTPNLLDYAYAGRRIMVGVNFRTM